MRCERDRTGPGRRGRIWRESRVSDTLRGPASWISPKVWQFADASKLPGVSHLPGWLGQTVLSLVTAFSAPGQRVLLLGSAAPAEDSGLSADPYAALGEALWTVMRLGRGVRHVAALNVGGSDREVFDLVIAGVPPFALKTALDVNLERLLDRRGTLAVITCGQSARGLPYGPVAEVVSTVREQGLCWLEHIVVNSGEMPVQPAGTGLPIRTIHNDVLVFGRPEERAADRSEDSHG